MIVFVTSRGHAMWLKSLQDGTFGFPVPPVEFRGYQRLFVASSVQRATYIFTDLERLSPWELRLASEAFRLLKRRGLRCLNDPARVMARVQLLKSLHAAGLNPFTIHRVDEPPICPRYPVFLRSENDHNPRLSDLLNDEAELHRALAQLSEQGIPHRGVVAVEYCPAPYSPGLWHKWGTFRIGERMSVDHIGIDDHWFVKTGVWEKLTEDAVAEEHHAVKTNRFSDELAGAFATAGVEFGRADHATVDGRPVVYEINTNPMLGPYVPDPNPLRLETQTIARSRFAESLAELDTPKTGRRVKLEPSGLLRAFGIKRRRP